MAGRLSVLGDSLVGGMDGVSVLVVSSEVLVLCWRSTGGLMGVAVPDWPRLPVLPFLWFVLRYSSVTKNSSSMRRKNLHELSKFLRRISGNLRKRSGLKDNSAANHHDSVMLDPSINTPHCVDRPQPGLT